MYWLTGIFGVFLIVAPFILGYAGNVLGMWTSIITGILVLVVSAIKGVQRDATLWEYRVAGVLGLLALIAPFVLGFRAQPTPLDANVILGAVLIVVAGYQLLTDYSHRSSQQAEVPNR
jgi:hypothetical protein